MISLGEAPDGTRIRCKVSGQSRAEVKEKLRALHDELSKGPHTSHTYTVRQCIEGSAPRRGVEPTESRRPS